MVFSWAVLLLGCNNAQPETVSPSLGVSLADIRSALPYFDYYLDDDIPSQVASRLSLIHDGQQPFIAASKYPDIAVLTQETVDLLLVGPQDQLTQATVLFDTDIDATEVGAFIYTVTPDDLYWEDTAPRNAFDWAKTGYRTGWNWQGFAQIHGNHPHVNIRVQRLGRFVAVTLTPPGTPSRPLTPPATPTPTPTPPPTGSQEYLQRFAQNFWEGPTYTCATRADQGACATYDREWTVYWFFAIDFTTKAMASVQLNLHTGPSIGELLGGTPQPPYTYVEVCFHQDYRQWYVADLTSCEDEEHDPETAITALRLSVANDWPELLEALRAK